MAEINKDKDREVAASGSYCTRGPHLLQGICPDAFGVPCSPPADPRTPPALSNATPRPSKCALCGKPLAEHFVSWCTDNESDTHQYTPAAPPVAEGPAATPRPITIQNETLYRDPDNPDCLLSEMQWKQRIAGPSGVSQPQAVSSWGVSENLTVLPMPAAAEPSEARAAARKWLDEHFQPHSQSGDYLRRDATDSAEYAAWDLMAEYASDLQRQLDNWKANARTAREYWRSAEAANQELRELAKQVTKLPQVSTQERAIMQLAAKAAALLGPQHGQKESE